MTWFNQYASALVLSASFWGGISCLTFAENITANRTDPIEVSAPVTWTVPTDSESYTFSGVISGTAAITKDGPGKLVFSGNNTANGSLIVNGGTLNLDNFNLFTNLTVNKGTANINKTYSNNTACLPTNCTITLGNAASDAAILNLNAQYGLHQFVDFTIYNNAELNLTVNSPENIAWNGGKFTFAGGGTVKGIGRWEHALTKTFVTGENVVAVVSCPCSMIETGNITVEDASSVLNISGALTQFGNYSTLLNKNGEGTVVLSGANTYKGATNVNAGTLKFDTVTALGASSEIVVNSGGILGFGTDFDSTDTFSKNVTFKPGSAIELEVNSSTDFASLNMANFTVTNPENLTTLYVDYSNYSGDPLTDQFQLISGNISEFTQLALEAINVPRGFEGVISIGNNALNGSFREIPEPASWLLLLLAVPFSLIARFRTVKKQSVNI